MPTKEDLLLSNQLRITIRGYIRMLRKSDQIEPEKVNSVSKLLREYAQIKRLERELESPEEPSYYQLLDSENGPPMEKRK